MQNDSIDNLRLDLNKKSVRGVIYVRSGDTRARTVHITLTSNGQVVDLSDAHICEIMIRKPDNNMNDQAVDMNEQAMVRYGNELQYTFRTQDINVPGECKCQVMITFNDGAVITSPEFSVMVYQKVIDQNLEKSTNEYTAVTQQLTEATNLRNQTAQDADRAEAAREGVEDYEERCRQYSENASDSASNAALSEDSASISAASASADKDLTKEYRDDAETFMEETRTNLAAVEDKATEILNYDSSAKESAEDAAASASSASDSATSAAASALAVDGFKETAEAYAVGTRDGVDVPVTDPAYHNNSKYYAEQAAQSAASFPTKLSEFTNDAGFITNTVNDLTNYYLKTQLYTQTEINNLIAAINEFNIEFVNTLPTSNIDTHTIYFLAKQTPEQNDYYDEYINTDATSAGWEKIGSTQVDLSQYYTKSEVDALLAGVSGGHEIIASDGTQMPQEPSLFLKDIHTSDDSVHLRTELEMIKNIVKADLENLTEDGIYQTTDEEDVPIGDIEEDSVSVTADGVKTQAQLLNDLYAKIDRNKLTFNTVLERNGGNIVAYFNLIQIRSSYLLFTQPNGGGSSPWLYCSVCQVHASNSLAFDSNTSNWTNNSSTVIPEGYVYTVHYGTSSTIINLKTDARDCMMSDGVTSVESEISDTNETLNDLNSKTPKIKTEYIESMTFQIYNGHLQLIYIPVGGTRITINLN